MRWWRGCGFINDIRHFETADDAAIGSGLNRFGGLGSALCWRSLGRGGDMCVASRSFDTADDAAIGGGFDRFGQRRRGWCGHNRRNRIGGWRRRGWRAHYRCYLSRGLGFWRFQSVGDRCGRGAWRQFIGKRRLTEFNAAIACRDRGRSAPAATGKDIGQAAKAKQRRAAESPRQSRTAPRIGWCHRFI